MTLNENEKKENKNATTIPENEFKIYDGKHLSNDFSKEKSRNYKSKNSENEKSTIVTDLKVLGFTSTPLNAKQPELAKKEKKQLEIILVEYIKKLELAEVPDQTLHLDAMKKKKRFHTTFDGHHFSDDFSRKIELTPGGSVLGFSDDQNFFENKDDYAMEK